MSKDWFRNKTWNTAIAETFNSKLARARRKAQYLRIQACTLADSEPRVALELLDRYFQLGDDFDHAQAYCDRATALLALRDTDRAIAAYESALKTEETKPSVITSAWLSLALVVARNARRELYPRALSLLEQHADRLMFPRQVFRFHASRALIFADQGNLATASVEARLAMDAAHQTDSGFRYHPRVGLVSKPDGELVAELEKLAAATPD